MALHTFLPQEMFLVNPLAPLIWAVSAQGYLIKTKNLPVFTFNCFSENLPSMEIPFLFSPFAFASHALSKTLPPPNPRDLWTDLAASALCLGLLLD